jgi:hypothetical protein
MTFSLNFTAEMIMEEVVRKNPKLWTVAIYLFYVAGFLYLKPSVAFGKDGNIRPFGVGKKESTVFPVWLWILGLAMAAYLTVVYILDFQF